MSLPFDRKYRPKCFEDVVGQDEAVGLLRSRIETRHNGPVLLVGPPGVGKTTLARVYANVRVCERPPGPCGKCFACEAFADGSPDFYFLEMNAGRHSKASEMTTAQEAARQGWHGNYVVFIDEVHILERGAQDALLGSLENTHPDTAFILATTNPDALSAAFRQRCTTVYMRPVPRPSLVALLRRICTLEGVEADPAALDICADSARGSAREAVKSLELAITNGRVELASLRHKLGMGWTDTLVALLAALLRDEHNVAFDALDQWVGAPATKVEAIHALLLHLYRREVAVPRIRAIEDAAFHFVTPDQRRMLVDLVNEFARQGGMKADAYWIGLIEFWETIDAKSVTDLTLQSKLTRFRYVMDQPRATVGKEARSSSRTTARVARTKARRSKTSQPLDAGRALLSLSQAEAIYDIASFLPQQYGVFFNIRVTMEGADGTPTKKFVDDSAKLLHQSAQFMMTRQPEGGLHRLAVWLQREGRPVCEALFAVSPEHAPEFIDWISGKLVSGQRVQVQAPEFVSKKSGKTPRVRAKRHWDWVRLAWATIDPALVTKDAAGNTRRLVDLLGVRTESQSLLPTKRAYAASASLSISAQNEAKSDHKLGLLSAFRDGAWDRLDDGWEITEHAYRRDERKRRAMDLEVVAAHFAGGSELELARQTVERDRLMKSWPRDPRETPRPWRGWW